MIGALGRKRNFGYSYSFSLRAVWELILGARLRGRTATQRSKKGSENVLGRVLGNGVLRRVLRRGPAMRFYSKKGSEKGSQRVSEKAVSRRCPERPLGECAR